MIAWQPINAYEIPGKAGSVRAWIKASVIYHEVSPVRAEVAHWCWYVSRERGGFYAEGQAGTLDAAKAACEAAAGPYLRMEALLPHLSIMAEMAALMPGCKPHLGVISVGEEGPKRLVRSVDFGEFTADLLRLLGYSNVNEINQMVDA